MHIKQILCVLLMFMLLLNSSAPVFATQNNEPTVAEVGEAMNVVSDSLLGLNDTASSGEAKSLAEIFKSFMSVADTTGKLLTLINGSTTFLRLIGVVTDPTQEKLSGILSKLQTIDERLSSMDDKLNDLTTAMSEIKASVEFNARTEKAILYESSWRDFEYRYMENSMDKLITQYNSMLRTGLMSWCKGTRVENDVDNSRVILLYQKTDSGYTLTFSDENGVPSDMTAEDRWIILPAACLPSSFSYDVNTFNTKLADDIAARISNAIANGDCSMFETQNYPHLTNEGVKDITEEEIKALAVDAVNTLVFRIASLKVNGDSTFAGEVSRQFSNYCTHLQTSGDGVDATLKTFYLTHAFEYSTADDIKDFCDRVIILTGTYGMFASNILGISHLTTDEEKVSAVSQMTSAIKMVEQAKKNGITGNGNYCYITGSNLKYTSVTFKASAEINAHYTMSNTTYQSYQANGPTLTISNNPGKNAVPAGDTTMIILANTLLSNGVTLDHSYLSSKIGNGSVKDYGKVVTGCSAAQTLSFDGKTKLHVKNTFGDYFKNNVTITALPDDADLEYVVYRKKISGSLYDLSSGSLASKATLCAIAVFGENHFYWITDEGAFMGGPADSASFKDSYDVQKTGADSTGVIRKHSYDMSNSYNILLSIPQEVKVSSGGEEGYNPLKSFQEDIPPIEYDRSDYGEGESKGDGLQMQLTQDEPEQEEATDEQSENNLLRSEKEEAPLTEKDSNELQSSQNEAGKYVLIFSLIAAAIGIVLVVCFVVKKKKQ